MWFKEHCFLRSPEWKSLLSQSAVWSFQTSQSPKLILRSRLCSILVDLPSLFMHCSSIEENRIYQIVWDERSEMLMHKACILFEDVRSWLTLEAEPLFLSHTSLQQVIQEQIRYPDIVCGVLDCVANTALLTINKILRCLCEARLRCNSLEGRDNHQSLRPGQLLDDPDITERWRGRAMTAFKYVQGESLLAAKPLDFGLRQIEAIGSSCSINS